MSGGSNDGTQGVGGTSTQIGTINNAASDDTLNLDNFDDAIAFIEENTKKRIINIHPTMLGVSSPLTLNAKEEIQVNMPDCNHNTINPKKVCHIMNNMTNNVMGIENTISRDMGADAEFLAIHWKKVSFNDAEIFSTSLKIYFPNFSQCFRANT